MNVPVNCPNCGASVIMSDERFATIRGKSVQCRKCQHVFIAQDPVRALPETSALAPVRPIDVALSARPSDAVASIAVEPAPAPIRRLEPDSLASMFQCIQCHGWFTVDKVYATGNQYICKRCHDAPAAFASPQAAPAHAYPQQGPPVVIQNVINNHAPAAYQPQRRWNPGTAALLSFLVPGLGQMYKGQVLNGIAWMGLVILGYVFFIVPGVVLHLICVIGASMGDPYR